ncbi:MAG TPA: hypothetical protein VF810_05180 [Patescibacteria group bacterium]
MVRRPAKKTKVNKGLLGAVGALVVGIAAGAAAIFLSDKENREMVKKTVDTTVKKGKVELAKAEKKISQTRKKLTRRR